MQCFPELSQLVGSVKALSIAVVSSVICSGESHLRNCHINTFLLLRLFDWFEFITRKTV